MAILAECPMCHRKQKVSNKLCQCGAKLDKIKKNNTNPDAKLKVTYWISYRLPGGKQRRESIGFSIEEARDAEGKRRSQKRENRIFDIKPEAKMTFNELTNWYLGLEKVKADSYCKTEKNNLDRFNEEFGNGVVNQLLPSDLKNYQAKRKKEGYADASVDAHIGAAKTMINEAFNNNLVGGDTLKKFKTVKKLLKVNANARDKIITPEQFKALKEKLPVHTKEVIPMGFWTGMRKGEIVNLTWDKVDLKGRMIQLEAADTKDRESRKVPISKPLCEILRDIPKAIHDNHVFLYKGKPLKDIDRSLETACKKAGITYGRFVKDGFIFHDLRHTFNTYMRKAGVAQSVIMSITGHAGTSMFDRYNTIDEEDLIQAVDQLERYFANVDQNVDQVEEKA